MILFVVLMSSGVNADNMKLKAMEYYKNRSEKFSPVKAYEMFEELAIAGDNEAKFFAYVTFYEFPKSLENKAPEAINYLAQSARDGNVFAQYNLGLILTKGLFLEQDIPLANQWLEKAANSGDAQAAAILGINLSKEYVVSQQKGASNQKLLKKTMKYLKYGEETKDADAMRTLAMLYYLDCQQPKNGVKYFKLAIEFGDEDSKQLLERIYKETGKEDW